LQVQSFLDSNFDDLGATAKANLNRALETLDGNIQWNEQHKQQIVDYLTEKMGNSATTTLITSLLMVLPVLLVKYL
jgi:hypothetical protein